MTSVHPVGTKTEFFERAQRESKSGHKLDAGPAWLMQRPEKVADRVVKALRKPIAEVWPMRSFRFVAALATAFPGLTAWALRKGYDKQRPPQQSPSLPSDAPLEKPS